MERQSRNRFEEVGLEDWSDVAPSQGLSAAIRSGERQDTRTSLEPAGEKGPATTWFQTSGFQNNREHMSTVLHHQDQGTYL